MSDDQNPGSKDTEMTAPAAEEVQAQSSDAFPGIERVAALEAELAEMRDRWMRSEADAQNARNRHRKEIEDARNYAVQKFATDVAETADNLRRGLDSLPAPSEGELELLSKLRGGFEGVERAFISMLERHGVRRIEAAGQPFDPALHQAMSEQPSPPGIEPGTILQAWTPAWTLNGSAVTACDGGSGRTGRELKSGYYSRCPAPCWAGWR